MKKSLTLAAISLFILGCGGSSSTKEKVDISTYFPNQNMTKSYFQKVSEGKNHVFNEDITVHGNVITTKQDDKITKTVSIEDSTIIINDIANDLVVVLKRELKEGGVLYTLPQTTTVEEKEYQGIVFGTESIKSEKECKLNAILEELKEYETNNYVGDILKFKCINETSIVTTVKEDAPDFINLTNGEKKSDYDISYFYMQKNIGQIVDINDDCIVTGDENIESIDDASKNCKEKKFIRTFFIE